MLMSNKLIPNRNWKLFGAVSRELFAIAIWVAFIIRFIHRDANSPIVYRIITEWLYIYTDRSQYS